MYRHPIRIEVKPKRQTQSKVMLIDIFFIFVQLTLAYDYGFYNYKSIKSIFLFKTIAFFQCSIVCVSCFYILYSNYVREDLYWYFYCIFAYFTYVMLLLLLKREKTFYSFHRSLVKINAELGIDSKVGINLEIKIILYYLISFSFRTLILFTYCTFYEQYCLKPMTLQLLFGIPIYGLDIPVIVNCFGYLSIYWSLRKMTDYLKNYNNEVLKCHYVYKSLYDSFDIVKSTFDLVTILSLLINIPSIMIMIYFTLREVSKTKGMFNMYSHAAEYMVILQEIILTFGPALAGGWVSSQANKIKLVLHDRLLEERGRRHEADIKRFIKYIEARPFKLRVCDIIPLNSVLPVLMIDICVTYLIVIIQLTHLY